MNDTTVKKVDSAHSPEGTMGQKYLASGVSVSMRLWEESPGSVDPQPMSRDYEVVGFVIKGTAELELEDQKLLLNPGESWLVPKHAVHRYRILEPFVAVEATAPPAHVHDRDSKQLLQDSSLNSVALMAPSDIFDWSEGRVPPRIQ